MTDLLDEEKWWVTRGDALLSGDFTFICIPCWRAQRPATECCFPARFVASLHQIAHHE